MAQSFLPEEPLFALDGTTLLKVLVAASFPGRWCGVRPEVTTAFYNKIQVNGLPRNATSVTLGKESRNSQVQSLGSRGNREIGKVSKKTSLILFSTIVTLFQIAQCKKLLEHPLKYT